MSSSVCSTGSQSKSVATNYTLDSCSVENDEQVEALLEQDVGEVTYLKDMSFKSEEMKHFLKLEDPPDISSSHPDYNAEHLFPQWILENGEWQQTAYRSKGNDISGIVQIAPNERTQEQNSTLIYWLMSVWPTAHQMGYMKCGMMWRGFSVLKYEPSQDIIVEGERGLTFYIIISGEAIVNKNGIGQVAQLGKGQCFGELALTAGNDLRNATVRAKTRVEVLQLHKVDYDRFVKDFQIAEKRENFLLLKECSLFDNWPKSKIKKMCNTCTRKNFNAGEYIFRQGDIPDAIYFVIDGKVELYKEVSVVVRNRWPSRDNKWEVMSKKKKKPFFVKAMKRGDFFGEQVIIDNKLRTVSCVASTACTLLCLDKLEFAHFLEKDVAIEVMKNAFEDYMQDKQILNAMVLNFKIKGGPSTSAWLNDCYEVVDRPGQTSILPKCRSTVSGSSSPNPRIKAKNNDRSGFLPPTSKPDAMPSKKFFSSLKVNSGVLADDDDLSKLPSQQEHLEEMKKERKRISKSNAASSNFQRQFSKASKSARDLFGDERSQSRGGDDPFETDDHEEHRGGLSRMNSSCASKLDENQLSILSNEYVNTKRNVDSIARAKIRKKHNDELLAAKKDHKTHLSKLQFKEINSPGAGKDGQNGPSYLIKRSDSLQNPKILPERHKSMSSVRS